MATYKELQNEIAALQRAAQEARTNEINSAVAEIKSLMAEHGITMDDLKSISNKKTLKFRASNVQFRDDSGNTWSGRGRMPSWLKGKDKEQFRVS